MSETVRTELLELVGDVYGTERGVGFLEESTHIHWRVANGDLYSELGISKLRIQQPASGKLVVIEADLFLGWAGDVLSYRKGTELHESPHAHNFLARFRDT